MAGTRLFYKLQFCGTTDCTTNHFPKVLAIENNIVFHFDVMLIENRLKQYFLPHITEFRSYNAFTIYGYIRYYSFR